MRDPNAASNTLDTFLFAKLSVRIEFISVFGRHISFFLFFIISKINKKTIMSRPVEEIPLLDVNPDDEYIEDQYIDDVYEDTVGDTTGAVGGEIKTPARRGSIEWEKKERDANISSESQNSIQDLNVRLNMLKDRDDINDPSLRKTIQMLERQKAELGRDEFYDYVSKEYGYTQQGTSFAREADFSVDDSG